MKPHVKAIGLGLGLAALAVRGGLSAGAAEPTAPETVFEQARAAYDGGRLDEAAQAYRTLAEQGWVAPELYYNWGNTLFRQGELGEAVVCYRKAFHLAPRDPDVAANLRFALRQAGAEEPTAPFLPRLFLKLSLSEWAEVLRIGYGVALAMALGYLLRPRLRRAARRGFAAAAVLLVLGAAGVWTWQGFGREPEAVALKPQSVFFAPMEGSTVHFALPTGALVRVEERAGDWLRVQLNGKSGWAPRDALKIVTFSLF